MITLAGHLLIFTRKNLLRQSDICFLIKKFHKCTIYRKTNLCFTRPMSSSIEIDPETYPLARRDEAIFDDFSGTKIADPYRWMENPDAEETQEFVKKLNEVSEPFLGSSPVRSLISEKLTKLWNYEKFGCPSFHGDFFYYYYNTGLQNQSVLFQQKTLDEKGEVFFDPNLLSSDGTTAIQQSSFSKDGKIFAYGQCEKGSDWTTIKFKTFDGKDLTDVIPGVKFSNIAWTLNNHGIFYSKFPNDQTMAKGTNPSKHEFHSVYYHKMGTNASDDVLVADFRDDPDYMTGVELSEDRKYLILSVDKGCDPTNMLYYCDLKSVGGAESINEKLQLTPLFNKSDAKYDFIDNESESGTALIQTNFEAPMFKLVRVKLNGVANQNAEWETVIEEDANRKLDWVSPLDGDKLLLGYIEDVKSAVYVHDAKTGRQLYQLPLGIGSVNGVFCRKSKSLLFIGFDSHLSPAVVYHGDFSKCTSREDPIKLNEIRRAKIEGLKSEDFEANQVFYESKDGTKIPMYIVSAKGVKRDGQNPVFMSAYGGFNISILPCFSISAYFLMKHFGMVLAYPTLRGGGEYGERWHEAGMRERKQNVFDDFHSAAEFLIKEKYTNPQRLAIQGGSNGGLLMAACSQQRPDLYGAVVNRVGVMDMLRFHKFTIGGAWVPEFGNPDEPKDFAYIFKYSPLHNIRFVEGQQWPATLLTTADHDDRVVPSHTLKYIAQLYHAVQTTPEVKQAQKKPLLALVEVKAGHGAGKPTEKVRVIGIQWRE